jgi:hypothetical protein
MESRTNREVTRQHRMEEWGNSQGTSVTSTSTEEDSIREEEFEKYQRRLTREVNKRKERESCEQVSKDLGKLQISMAAQGKKLEGLRLSVSKRGYEVNNWKVKQLTRELTLIQERDRVKKALQKLTEELAITQPGLRKELVCFGCGKPGHMLKFCRGTTRSTRFSRVQKPFQFGSGKDRVVQ